MGQKVYIAEQGLYEQRGVAGIYDSPERAIGALHQDGDVWTRTTWTHYPKWPDRSVIEHSVEWSNDKDWDSHVSISESEITDTGALRRSDKAQVQTLREDDGGWDYVAEAV